MNISDLSNRGGVSSIYLLKLFGAFCVICIHYYPYYYPIIRTAVPIFFMISGFFLYKSDRVEAVNRCKSALIKTGWLTLYANIFYFLAYFYSNELSRFLDHKFIITTLIAGTCFHLWYLVAYLQVLIIVIIALKLKKERLLWYVAPLFFIFGLLTSCYNFAFPLLNANIYLSRNFLTMGIPCFALGWLIRQHKDTICKTIKRPVWLSATLFALSVAEYTIVHKIFNLGRIGDYMILTIPFAASLLILCIKHPQFGQGTVLEFIGKHYATDIYIYHIIAGGLITRTLLRISSTQNALVHALVPFLIFGVTLLFAIVWRTASEKVFVKQSKQ